MCSFEEVYKYSKDLAILYVEDDLDLLYEVKDIFVDFFKIVDTAVDGKEALDKYIAYYEKNLKYYDIVISDINMPRMDGLELTKQLYKYNENQVIIIISAHDKKEYLLEFINLGIEQFLVKPLELDKILITFYKVSNTICKKNDILISNSINIATNYIWDTTTAQLFFKQEVVKLSKKESLLLNLLVKNKDKVSTIDEIFHTLWQEDFQKATMKSLKAIISRFRRKYPDIKIENVYSIGYKLQQTNKLP